MEAQNPTKVIDDVVVVLNYTVKVDGEVIDSSVGDEPLEILQGYGNVIPGVERALYGMEPGQKKDFTVSAADGYGEVDPDALAEVPRDEFPPDFPLQPGVELLLKDGDGDELEAYIMSVGKDTITLNFNHPLAGKELDFWVEVVSLRTATPGELEHGHVHHPDHEH